MRANNLPAAAILFSLYLLTAAACTPPSEGQPTSEPGTPSPVPQTETTVSTASQVPVGTLPPVLGTLSTKLPEATKNRTATPTASQSATGVPPTPTQEFCETVPIEYVVIANVLNVRESPGGTVVGALIKGEHFTGTLCLDRVGEYDWTQITQAGHRYQGKWVAYRAVNGEQYLE